MIPHTRVKFLAIAVGLCFLLGVAIGDLVESGDLNIIDDPGNPSDGLRFLDMTFSDELSLADALTNAQATYLNARLAVASEFDDLFAAVPIVYDGAETASSSFAAGANFDISSGSNYDVSLRDKLGLTNSTHAIIWTAPDGNSAASISPSPIHRSRATAGSPSCVRADRYRPGHHYAAVVPRGPPLRLGRVDDAEGDRHRLFGNARADDHCQRAR